MLNFFRLGQCPQTVPTSIFIKVVPWLSIIRVVQCMFAWITWITASTMQEKAIRGNVRCE